MENKKQQLLELLKLHYGFDKFRPGQEKVIDNILEGKSTVVIMPTGGGKSLCYQLPALVLDKVTIVVSPLIALMKDQVDSLLKIGIPATFVNSSLSQAETVNRLDAVRRGEYKLLYIAPERFYSTEFLSTLEAVKVGLFAIDEAHCISQWGHDFRPSYLRLRQSIALLGQPAVVALTATATPEVKRDIIKQLNLTEPEVVITGFARPNLQFGVISTQDSRKPQFVLDAISGAPQGAGIVYVSTRSRADDLLQVLLENNIEAVSYHAGMETEDRRWVQENFMGGKAKVIVATNAFGLGINKSDIRYVIHYDMPGTLEAYYQEAGRAGRDGRPSFCLLLYSSRDRYLQEFFIKGDNPPPEVILEIYEILKSYESDTVLITYAELVEILNGQVPEMAIGTSLKILEHEGLITRSHEKSGSAFIKLICDFEEAFNSLGQRAKRQREILAALSDRFKNDMIDGWQVNLEEAAGTINTSKEALVRLVRKLSGQNKLEYRPPFKGTEIRILKRISKHDIEIDFSALRAKLRNAHQKLDQMEDYIYHGDCRQKYIMDYFGDLSAKPCAKCDNCLTGGLSRTVKQEAGLKEKKYQSYQYNKSAVNSKPAEIIDGGVDYAKRAKLATKLTQLETYDLFNKGMSIEEIAQARELTTSVIVQHLCFVADKRLPIDFDKLIDKTKQKKIIDAGKEVGWGKISVLKEMVGDEISLDEIRLIIAQARSKKILG